MPVPITARFDFRVTYNGDRIVIDSLTPVGNSYLRNHTDQYQAGRAELPNAVGEDLLTVARTHGLVAERAPF